ncbi:MAG: 50S ribosomal protein L24 [bacterium]|nr:50S ribosomal protein L24 [bacterium]
MNIKKNDNVIVIAGKDRGKKAKVLQVFPKLDSVLIEGVNLKKRRSKSRAKGREGITAEISAPIHISNVMLFDASVKKGVRVGYIVENGKKTRISRATGKAI